MSYRFASLSSGLLARKGTAQPAMATHGGGNPRVLRDSIQFVTATAEPETSFKPNPALTRAGYSYEQGPPPFPPMGRAQVGAPKPAPVPAPTAVTPPAAARSAQPMTGCGAMGSCASEMADADPAKRFHVSVRLKQTHFVRLKIASAQLRKPSQEIIAEALAAYFQRVDPKIFGDCACIRE